MKILKLSPYCRPEQVTSSHLARDLDEAYFASGYTFEIFSPTPTRGVTDEVRKKYSKIKYEEQADGKVIIHRFSMFREGKNPIQRAFRYVLVNIIQYYKGIHAKGIEVIYAPSTPPTQGLLCGLVKRKLNVPFVYSLQDVFPDSLVNAGMTKKGSIIWKIGRKIENFTYSSADKIIVISEGIKKNIIEKGVPEEKIVVISNWIDLEAVQPISRDNNELINEFKINPSKFIVVYAGNFGAAQGADIVLKAAKQLEFFEDIQFVVFGGGAYFDQARAEAENLENVFIHELMPQNRISEVYSLGNVALITCKKGTGNAGMPSKTWSIMACNTPIIASFDTNSDLCEVIRHSGAGKCVIPENVDALVEAIKDQYNSWRINGNTMIDLRKFVQQSASKSVCAQKYVDVTTEVIKNWK